MHTLRGHEYNYEIFFSFRTLTEYVQNFVDIFSLVFLIFENYFVFFSINFVSSKAYAVVSNNYKKIMKYSERTTDNAVAYAQNIVVYRRFNSVGWY